MRTSRLCLSSPGIPAPFVGPPCGGSSRLPPLPGSQPRVSENECRAAEWVKDLPREPFSAPGTQVPRPPMAKPMTTNRLSRLLLALLCLLPVPTDAQSVIDFREDLDFDRPEAWALKYFSGATLFDRPRSPRAAAGRFGRARPRGGLDPQPVRRRTPGGFNGTKVEDLNKTPIFARPRLTVGLPAASLAHPGLRAAGRGRRAPDPYLVSLALGRPLVERDLAAGLPGLRPDRRDRGRHHLRPRRGRGGRRPGRKPLPVRGAVA